MMPIAQESSSRRIQSRKALAGNAIFLTTCAFMTAIQWSRLGQTSMPILVVMACALFTSISLFCWGISKKTKDEIPVIPLVADNNSTLRI
jgi:hypothetical protein